MSTSTQAWQWRCFCVWMFVYVRVGKGVWGKREGTTYIMTLLALSLIEFSSFAIAVSLGVIPVVPVRGSVGVWGRQCTGHLWPIHPVLRVHSGKEDRSAIVETTESSWVAMTTHTNTHRHTGISHFFSLHFSSANFQTQTKKSQLGHEIFYIWHSQWSKSNRFVLLWQRRP